MTGRPLAIRGSLVALAMLSAASGCSKDEGATPPSGDQVVAAAEEQAERETGRRLPADMQENACALLTEAKVREVFALGADVKIERPPGRVSCAYTWEKPNADELQAEIERVRQAHLEEMMKQIKRGKTAQGIASAMNMPSTTARVSLSLNPRPAADAAEARAQFESGMRVLQKGVTRRIEHEAVDESVTFQADLEAVDGVGDDARWAPRLHQLSVLAGARIFHVTVEVGVEPTDDLPFAKRLAAALIE